MNHHLKTEVEKQNAWSAYLSAPNLTFCFLNLLFTIPLTLLGAKTQFQTSYFQSIKARRAERLWSLTYFVNSQKSFEVFHTWWNMFSVTEQMLMNLSTEPLTVISNFEYWNLTFVAYKIKECILHFSSYSAPRWS